MSATTDRRPVQLPLGVQLRESASFNTFFAGPNTELVHQLENIAAASIVGSSVHFVCGPESCGKTHLLQATSRAAGAQGRSSAYLPLAELLRSGPAVIEGMAQQSLVCLDDVDAVVGHRNWEEALMALSDGLRANGGHLLATATRPPMELGLVLKDLATRLAWGPVYALKPLSDDDKLRLLQQRALGRGLEMPEEVGRFLLTRGSREIPMLLSVLDRLDHASLAAQRRLTLPFVRTTLGC
jgi:DnaA-homolog protein